jgi:hypothetical protein
LLAYTFVDDSEAEKPRGLPRAERNVAMYPRIFIMARDHLGVTATSISSECAFSRAGSSFESDLTRLSDDEVQAICELQSFMLYKDGKRGQNLGRCSAQSVPLDFICLYTISEIGFPKSLAIIHMLSPRA